MQHCIHSNIPSVLSPFYAPPRPPERLLRWAGTPCTRMKGRTLYPFKRQLAKHYVSLRPATWAIAQVALGATPHNVRYTISATPESVIDARGCRYYITMFIMRHNILAGKALPARVIYFACNHP